MIFNWSLYIFIISYLRKKSDARPPLIQLGIAIAYKSSNLKIKIKKKSII